MKSQSSLFHFFQLIFSFKFNTLVLLSALDKSLCGIQIVSLTEPVFQDRDPAKCWRLQKDSNFLHIQRDFYCLQYVTTQVKLAINAVNKTQIVLAKNARKSFLTCCLCQPFEVYFSPHLHWQSFLFEIFLGTLFHT